MTAKNEKKDGALTDDEVLKVWADHLFTKPKRGKVLTWRDGHLYEKDLSTDEVTDLGPMSRDELP